MIIFWLTCLLGYPRTSAPEPVNAHSIKQASSHLALLDMLWLIMYTRTTTPTYNKKHWDIIYFLIC